MEACRISIAILTIIISKFFGLEVIIFEDSTTKTIFLYNKLGQIVVQSQGSIIISQEVRWRNTNVGICTLEWPTIGPLQESLLPFLPSFLMLPRWSS
jgi:hypothetical protein